MAIYLALVNNQPKGWLIHDIVLKSKSQRMKVTAVREEPMSHQLVGGVMDHQGYDGYQV